MRFKRNKRRILAFGMTLLIAVAFLTAGDTSVRLASAHDDPAYSHDSGPVAHYPNWMRGLAPATKLTDVSIPGTHDSGTYPGLGDDLIAATVAATGTTLGAVLAFTCPPCAALAAIVAPFVVNDIAQTQTMDIAASLESGIRYLDIRLRNFDYPAKRFCDASYSSPDCALHTFHGIFPYTAKFEPDVLRPVMEFLVRHPSEFVLMKVVAEGGERIDVRRPLEALLGGSIVVDGVTYQYEDLLLHANETGCGSGVTLDNVTVGPRPPFVGGIPPAGCTARGKLLLFPASMSHDDAPALSKDHYFRGWTGITPEDHVNYREVDTNFDLHDYFLESKALLDKANSDSDHTLLYENQLVTARGGFPYFFASGHSSPGTGALRLSTGLVTGLTATFGSPTRTGNGGTYPYFKRVECLANIFTPTAPLCTIAFEGMNSMVADYLSKTDIGPFHNPNQCQNGTWAVSAATYRSFHPAKCTSELIDNANFRPAHPEFHTPTSRVGIVVADFPGKRLIEAIANVNPGVNLGGAQPPTAAPTKLPPENGYGWNNTDVTVMWNWTPNVGAIDTANCTQSSLVTGEGKGLNVNAFCSDTTGNTGDGGNHFVSIDKTPPTIGASATTSPNANGWYNGNVTVHFTCTDPLSGIPAGACPADETLSAQGGAGASTSQTVTDAADNTSLTSNIVTVKIDKARPTISAAATTSPNANGWYKGNVTVHFTCTDPLSGIPAGACPADQTLSEECGFASTSQTVTDAAGNTSLASNIVTVKIDKTKATFTSSPSPILDATSEKGAVVSYRLPPAIDNCSVPVVVCTLPSNSLFAFGVSAVNCRATDLAGNVANLAFNVNVRAPFTVNQDVRALIAALRAAVTDKKDRDELDDALKHFDKALNPLWWTNASHLSERHGEKVFNEEKHAVKELAELIKNKKRPNPTDAALMNLIARLVQADRVLALVSISEERDPKKRAKALNEIAKGDAERDRDTPDHADNAIDHYRNAWKKT